MEVDVMRTQSIVSLVVVVFPLAMAGCGQAGDPPG
jgi:hypothetical protein